MINMAMFNRLMTAVTMLFIVFWFATGFFWKHIAVLAKMI